MVRPGLIFKFIFFFAGTFLHESAHYLAALILGKAEGFSVLPRIEGNRFVFGNVKSRTRYRVLSSFIASAPLIWWAALLLIMVHIRLIRMSGNIPVINFHMILGRIKAFSQRDLFFVWLFLQLLWAGKLSMQDVRNFFTGLFSVSGIMLLAGVSTLGYLFRNLL